MNTHKNTDYTYRNHCRIFRDFLGRNKMLLPKYNAQKIAVYYVWLGNKSPSAHLKMILTLATLKSIKGTIADPSPEVERHMDSQWKAGNHYGFRQKDILFRAFSWLSQKTLSPILQVWNPSWWVKHEGSCQLKGWCFLGEWDIYRDCTGHSMGW